MREGNVTAERTGASGASRAPRRRDSERTRAKIINIATREFSQHGFAGARTETIARRAKCNIRLIYHHFKSKQGLYLTVIEAAYADIRAKESQLEFELADPVGSLEKLLRFTFEYFERNTHFEGLLQAENLIQGRFVRRSKRVPQSALRLKSTLNEIIRSGQSSGSLRPGLDAVQLYVTITALSRFHRANAFSLSALLGEDLRSPSWRAEWLDHSVKLLRAYVGASVQSKRQ